MRPSPLRLPSLLGATSTLALGLACAGLEDLVPAEPGPPTQDEAPTPAGELPPLQPIEGERDPDCTLDLANLEPMLSPTQGGAKVRARKGPHRFVERFTRDDGIAIRLTRGGCEHYGETWEIVLTEGADPRVFAISALEAVELSEDKTISALDALKEASDLDEHGAFPCGEVSYCTLTVEDGVVRVVYDFSM